MVHESATLRSIQRRRFITYICSSMTLSAPPPSSSSLSFYNFFIFITLSLSLHCLSHFSPYFLLLFFPTSPPSSLSHSFFSYLTLFNFLFATSTLLLSPLFCRFLLLSDSLFSCCACLFSFLNSFSLLIFFLLLLYLLLYFLSIFSVSFFLHLILSLFSSCYFSISSSIFSPSFLPLSSLTSFSLLIFFLLLLLHFLSKLIRRQ